MRHAKKVSFQPTTLALRKTGLVDFAFVSQFKWREPRCFWDADCKPPIPSAETIFEISKEQRWLVERDYEIRVAHLGLQKQLDTTGRFRKVRYIRTEQNGRKVCSELTKLYATCGRGSIERRRQSFANIKAWSYCRCVSFKKRAAFCLVTSTWLRERGDERSF